MILPWVLARFLLGKRLDDKTSGDIVFGSAGGLPPSWECLKNFLKEALEPTPLYPRSEVDWTSHFLHEHSTLNVLLNINIFRNLQTKRMHEELIVID